MMKKRKTNSALRDLLNFAPITETAAFNLARVHRTTWARWLDGSASPPPATLDLIRIHAFGEIVAPGFNGWRAAKGVLIDPDGRRYPVADLKMIELWKRHSSAYLDLLDRQAAEKRAIA